MLTLIPLFEVENNAFGFLEMWALVHCYTVELGLSTVADLGGVWGGCISPHQPKHNVHMNNT